MYRKILIGYDNSDHSRDALVLGNQLRDATGAQLYVGGVLLANAPGRAGVGLVDADETKDFAERLEGVAARAGATAEVALSSSPARGLHQLAEDIEADVIVVGSSRHGALGQTLLGNVGVALMHGSPCAVGVAPAGYRDSGDHPISRLVVGFDGSPEAELALNVASELARDTGAKLSVVGVAEPPVRGTGKGDGGWQAVKNAIEEETRDMLVRACAELPEELTVEPHLVSGKPARALADAARERGDLLVLGSRGYGPLRRVLLGSVSRELARTAPAPLLVQPRGAHEPASKAEIVHSETA